MTNICHISLHSMAYNGRTEHGDHQYLCRGEIITGSLTDKHIKLHVPAEIIFDQADAPEDGFFENDELIIRFRGNKKNNIFLCITGGLPGAKISLDEIGVPTPLSDDWDEDEHPSPDEANDIDD